MSIGVRTMLCGVNQHISCTACTGAHGFPHVPHVRPSVRPSVRPCVRAVVCAAHPEVRAHPCTRDHMELLTSICHSFDRVIFLAFESRSLHKQFCQLHTHEPGLLRVTFAPDEGAVNQELVRDCAVSSYLCKYILKAVVPSRVYSCTDSFSTYLTSAGLPTAIWIFMMPSGRVGAANN